MARGFAVAPTACKPFRSTNFATSLLTSAAVAGCWHTAVSSTASAVSRHRHRWTPAITSGNAPAAAVVADSSSAWLAAMSRSFCSHARFFVVAVVVAHLADPLVACARHSLHIGREILPIVL